MHDAKKGTLKNSHLVLVGKVENGFRHAHHDDTKRDRINNGVCKT